MACSRPTALAFAVLVVLPSLALADRESTPLGVFPDDVSMVVRLRNPQQTFKKVTDLADVIDEELGDLVRGGAAGQGGARGAVGSLISNPDLAGVDTAKDWWLGIFLASDQMPAFVFAIPANDVAAMEKSLGDQFDFFQHESWGIYSDRKNSFKRVQACAEGKGKSVATVIDKTSTALFDKGDVSAFINIRELKTSFQDQLELGKQQLEKPPDMPESPVPGIDPETVQKIRANLVKWLLQAANDSNQCAIALQLSNEWIRVEQTLQLASGSATAIFLQSSAGSEQILAELPVGFPVYFAALGNFRELGNIGTDILVSMASDNDTVKQAADRLQQVEYRGIAVALKMDSKEEAALSTISVTETADTKALQAATRQLMRNLGTIEGRESKSTYTLKEDAEKYGSNTSDVATVSKKSGRLLGGQMLKKMYGAQGMTTRTVYLKDRVVQTMGGGKELMTQALAALQGTGSETAQEGMQTTRRMLDEKPGIVLMVDLAALIASSIEVKNERGAVRPLDPNILKEIAGKPPYIGFSLQCSADSMHTTTVVPVAQIRSIVQMVDAWRESPRSRLQILPWPRLVVPAGRNPSLDK